ncbi:hypothetical protein Q8A67_012865 [Cirrhinus molitorella]|uniref:Podocalyxin n=1 Tax=Cirrhinus molitorella TaxID=172907 RepID=A0AA88TMT8_9TELE|nr:hypothetical protein Q8A67_012865 [Cirrhinus molitorella]
MKMAITWTIIVLGALLHGMQCNADDSSTTIPSTNQTSSLDSSTDISNKLTDSLPSSSATATTNPPAPLDTTKAATQVTLLEPIMPATTTSSPKSPTLAVQTTEVTSLAQTVPSSATSQQNPTTIQIATTQPIIAITSTTLTASNDTPPNSATSVITSNPTQDTTISNRPTTNIPPVTSTTQLKSTQTPAVAKNPTVTNTAATDSKSTDSQSVGTTKAQTTATPNTPSSTNNEDTTTRTSTPQEIDNILFDLNSTTEVNDIRKFCKTLGQKVKGNCKVTTEKMGTQFIITVTVDAHQQEKPENDTPPTSGVTDPLIAILASCGALVFILCCFAAYCTYHRRSYRKNQQHLTEELQTVENGYHDNPTLEVMEVQPEMQEKKMTLNGEFNDSWIVPIDNLLKEDIPDEEDTHL